MIGRTNPDKAPAGVTARFHSLDVLRGFDMFWIVGGGTLVGALANCFPANWLQSLSRQMEHVPWAGFHFLDLIFPLFMFISGVTIPIAILSKQESGVPKKELLVKITRRMIVLVLLGIIFNGALRDGFSNARYASVLGQIGISYFIASVIVINTRTLKARLFWLSGILAGYAAIQLLIPVPGYSPGTLTPEISINAYIDRLFLPGRMGQGTYDALGLMNILSASAITLMGSLAGLLLKNSDLKTGRKVLIMVIVGTGMILLALAINPYYPVIKKCWTTTYNLLSGGICFLLLALFHIVIDVWAIKKWSGFFRIIGLNSILIYLIVVGNLASIETTTTSFFGWIAKMFGTNGGNLAIAVGNIIVMWLLLYFLYRKKIFLKV
jgi:predicted acyltransferase